MVSKSFLEFLDAHEKKLEDFIREEESEVLEEEIVVEPVRVIKKTFPTKVIQKPQMKTPPIKESSNAPFSFCTSCGKKIPDNIMGKFCCYCGKETVMRTDSKNKIAVKSNSISENVNYAANILDEENPMTESRLITYLEKNPVKNPISEMLKANRSKGQESQTVISENADRASELLDGTSDVGGVKLLEMPDFSKFMPPKETVKVIQEAEVIQNLPMAPSNTQINDPNVEAQLRSLGLI
jgi:predicted RNA-binding Zn-ribbon protein involved in translation (DUF1610 family)